MVHVVFEVLFLVLAVPLAGTILVAALTPIFSRRKINFSGKHVFITGGSEGLGRAIALQLVEAGADVTIVARRAEVLQTVVDEATKSSSSSHGRIFFQTADVTKPDAIQKAVDDAQAAVGPIHILIPCAGKALTGYMKDHTIEVHRRAMDLNYFGTLNTVNAVLPTLRQRQQGTICFVTSGAAMTSYVGYSAYSPSKYAVRGLADCLRNELTGTGVSVHIAFPGGMDTPGYADEMRAKPEECKAIEASDTLYKPEAVAKSILKDLSTGAYNIYCGDIGINLLGILGAGMSPRKNPALDVLLFPIAVIAGFFVRGDWAKHVENGNKKRVD
ncbi:unnamed protein product [Aphanomyces euteiches]|uniref:3-dehydrosphinganine reductase n=1 Tax=Aphanomyces euteiches TaxID=100861 RepID=A0A6G0X1B3_9STRA|nr:hypothetical protein Ae201684_009514 [Aphanomyces euteiches]KAH9085994.1 hypothetical protein Ae201684P_005690 [Aphanomyces euteiches]KAH9155970.1 hypothetical protein AeRB84_002102 [Aphanomyces euteiches]